MANLFVSEMNPSTLQDTGKKLKAWLGLPPEQLPDLLEQMQPVLAEVDLLYEMNISRDVNAVDLIQWARESLLTKTLAVFQEVEQFKEKTVEFEMQTEQLEAAAQQDPLTQVYNRGFLDAYVEKAFQKALRDGSPLTLGFLDLDHFKHVNDTYGHLVGDQVLKAAATLLLSHVRTSDVVARYGGEEFLVVLPDTLSAGAQNVFHRILEAFRQARHEISEGPPISVTVSMGVVTHSSERPFPNVVALVEAADHAMYVAKAHGRNQCVIVP